MIGMVRVYEVKHGSSWRRVQTPIVQPDGSLSYRINYQADPAIASRKDWRVRFEKVKA